MQRGPPFLSQPSLQPPSRTRPVTPLRSCPPFDYVIPLAPPAPNPLIIFTRRSDSPAPGGPIPFTFHYELATIPTIEPAAFFNFFFPFLLFSIFFLFSPSFSLSLSLARTCTHTHARERSFPPLFPSCFASSSSLSLFGSVRFSGSFFAIHPSIQSRSTVHASPSVRARTRACTRIYIRTRTFVFVSPSMATLFHLYARTPWISATGRCMCSPRLEWYLGISACVLPDAAPARATADRD